MVQRRVLRAFIANTRNSRQANLRAGPSQESPRGHLSDIEPRSCVRRRRWQGGFVVIAWWRRLQAPYRPLGFKCQSRTTRFNSRISRKVPSEQARRSGAVGICGGRRPLPAASSCDRGRYRRWFNEDPPAWLHCTNGGGAAAGGIIATTPADRLEASHTLSRPTGVNETRTGRVPNGKRRPAEMIAGAALAFPKSDTEIPAGNE